MQKELKALVKEFDRQPINMLRINLNLYQKSISTVTASFLRQLSSQAKKLKSNEIILIAIIKDAQ